MQCNPHSSYIFKQYHNSKRATIIIPWVFPVIFHLSLHPSSLPVHIPSACWVCLPSGYQVFSYPLQSLGRSEMVLVLCNRSVFLLDIRRPFIVVVPSVDPAGQIISIMAALVWVRFSPRSRSFLLLWAWKCVEMTQNRPFMHGIAVGECCTTWVCDRIPHGLTFIPLCRHLHPAATSHQNL